MDLIITGGAGFLGSHILFKWLCQYPQARVLCLARSSAGLTVVERIGRALALAAYECNAKTALAGLLERVTPVDADITHPQWREHALVADWLDASAGFEVIHGAANLSFREEDRPAVWHSNVTGTICFFDALAGLAPLRHFNYISTAYVAGTAEGTIPETLGVRPQRFNNVYEESKWAAEQVVAEMAQQQGKGYRIFRPSIIIGHSQTYRISAKTGFYKVLETLAALGKMPPTGPSTGIGPIQLPVNRSAGVNLIPVDLVTVELMDIVAAGPASAGRVYHLTNERPLSLADMFFGVTPLTGVTLSCGEQRARPANGPAALVTRGLRHYLPYLRYAREFERGNVQAFGAGRHQAAYWLDLTRLREYVCAFLAEEGAATPDERVSA